MGYSLPIEKMTNIEKILAMEKLWEDLCRDPQAIDSPTWHGEILAARERSVKAGKSKFVTLKSAKEIIKDRLK
ncbi:MAG: addiction module protein [Desulfobacterales bacterium]|nr:addiction module protein [Desulfobacterales bacterium]